MPQSNRVLLVDDEPEYLQWLDQFLQANGYSVEHSKQLADALHKVSLPNYTMIIVDLNIPAPGTLLELVANEGPMATKFPGLIVVSRARNNGYSQREVVAYTVHADAGVEAELAKLGCSYILKGRPQSLKGRLHSTMQFPYRGSSE